MAICVDRLLLSVLIGGLLLGGPLLPAQAAETPAVQNTAKMLSVIDLSELQLDGAAALVLTFNTAIDSKQDVNALVHISDERSGKVDGGWELAQNGKALRFRHPDRSVAQINRHR